MALAKFIQRKRREKDVSQEEVARHLGRLGFR
jgi:hypothetical protein